MRAGNLDHATRILLGCLQQHQAARDDAASAVVVEQADAANAHRSTAASAVVHAAVCSATAQHIKQQTCQLCRQGSLSDLHQVYHRTQQLIQPLPWAVGVMHSQSSLMQGLNVHMQMGHRLIATSQCLHSRRHPASLAAAAHQPAKHVPGTDPLKLLKAANAAATAGRGAVAAAAVNNTAAAQAAAITVKEPWHVRFKAGAQAWLSKAKTALPHLALVLFVCVTGSLSLWLNAQVAVLENTRKILAGKNPNAITHQLSSLQQLMSHDFAQKLVDKGIIQDMVALVEPGTDAILLYHLFVLLNRLLAYGGDVKDALLQSELLEALTRGLTDGWMPRGAVEAASILQQRLRYQQQRRLPPSRAASK